MVPFWNVKPVLNACIQKISQKCFSKAFLFDKIAAKLAVANPENFEEN